MSRSLFPPSPQALIRSAVSANANRLDLDTLLDRLLAWQDVRDRAERLSAQWQEAAMRAEIYQAAFDARSQVERAA